MQFRSKTILGVALIEMILLAVLVGSTLSILRDSNESELTRRVQLGGKLLVASAKDALIGQDLATLDSLVQEAHASGQIDYVRIVDATGMVMAEAGEKSLLARSFVQDSSVNQVSDGIFDWSAPVVAGGILHGEVRLGVSTDPLQGLLASAWRWAAGIAGLEMLLVALFSWLLGSYLLRQLLALRDASTRFAAGDFSHRVEIRGNDELTRTALAFNEMAQQIGESRVRLESENARRIEAQKRSEQAMAHLEERTAQLNAIFALSPDGFVSFDRDGRVSHVNPAFSRMTGLELAALDGLDESAFLAALAGCCNSRSILPNFGVLHEARSGARHLIETGGAGIRILDVSLRRSDAANISQILYVRDVTHEIEVDRLKSEFLSTAAHELRTPMVSIFGFSELLLTYQFSEEEQREFLELIHRQSELLGRIINEIIDLARIEARRGRDFNFERLDLGKLLRDFLVSATAPAGRALPVVSTLPENCLVRADRQKLMQAASHVLANAYNFSAAEHPVEVEIIIDRQQERPVRFGLRFRDHGVGMTPEQLQRACERFYRADTSGKQPGSGLGLSIVKEIVELHGGEISLESERGRGTVATLWLPAITDQ